MKYKYLVEFVWYLNNNSAPLFICDTAECAGVFIEKHIKYKSKCFKIEEGFYRTTAVQYCSN